MIEIRNLSKSFDQGLSYAVQNVSLSIETGETLVLLGSSGCGKSTTLKMINRLIEPTAGEIIVDDCNILDYDAYSLRRKIGYVFQGIGLFPHMTVTENISIVLRLADIKKSQRKKTAYELMEFVNLDPAEFAHRYPRDLSGGQQQRVGVARALAYQPAYLLMDEPFGALDAITRDNLQEDFMALKQRLNKTVVFVTHDIIEALRLADRIVVMDAGVIQQIGSKDDICNHPANEFVRDLVSKPREQYEKLSELISGKQ